MDGDIPINTPTNNNTTTTTTTTSSSSSSSSNNNNNATSSHNLIGSGAGSSKNLKYKNSLNNLKWKKNENGSKQPMDRSDLKKKAQRKESERKLNKSSGGGGILKKKNTLMDIYDHADDNQGTDGNITEGLPITEGESLDISTPISGGGNSMVNSSNSALGNNTTYKSPSNAVPPNTYKSPYAKTTAPTNNGEFDTLVDPDLSPEEMEEKMRQARVYHEQQLQKELHGTTTTSSSSSSKALSKEPEIKTKEKFNPKDNVETLDTINGEAHKQTVYEIKPYFSHSVLQATMAVFLIWNLFYFAYRAGWTINKTDWYTISYSIIFLIVEFISFLGSALHLNNFTNPCTFILVVTLEQILQKRRLTYPTVTMFICTYKEPPSIVSRTFRTAISMSYPADKLWIGLLDDSVNFRESRGWAHVQSVEKNFLYIMLQRAVYAVHRINPPETDETDDPHGILTETSARIEQTTKEVIESEVQWFIEYFLLNAWSGAENEISKEVTNAERDLISKLREDSFTPYRTFTKAERETVYNFSIESLQSLWHGSAFFRPLIRSVLMRKNYVKEFVKVQNDQFRLRFINPETLDMAHYHVLMMGREEVPWDEISAGNVRIDFQSASSVITPKCTYLRRRKPPIPHNKAGNINNALFNESTDDDFEFMGLLDADQQPHPDFLKRVLPYFYSDAGKDCAFVQTPQFFNNIYPVDDPLGHRNMEFYGPVMEGRSANDACPFVGTNAVFRRKPLFDIGGIMYNSVTEDMYTGMKLQVSGFKSWYHNEVLVVGTAPVDIKETLEQRKRWAQGAVEIFSLTPWGYIRKKLGWRKMLYNLDSCIYPFLSWTAFFYGISPLIMSVWTVPIVVKDPIIFILVGMIPVMILPRVIQYMVLRARRPYEANKAGPSLWVEATDLWRAEQTFFAFAGTYISAWKEGSASIVKLLKSRKLSRHQLAMWNWQRDFIKRPVCVPGFRQFHLKDPIVHQETSGSKKTEQSFRSSNKESDTIKNSRLFFPNIILFILNIVAMLSAFLRFNCFQNDMWLLIVVAGFAFSTCWHLWSFIPMALRQSEKQWPYASSYHAHNILVFIILAFLVLLFVDVKVCIPRVG